MTKDELVDLLEHCDRNIYVSEAFTCEDKDFIIKKYASYKPTTQTIFEFEKDNKIKYYDYYLFELDTPNHYGEKFIALPDQPGMTLEYAYCDKQSMLDLLDKRIRLYEEVLKEVKQKNKEWKMGKDFE